MKCVTSLSVLLSLFQVVSAWSYTWLLDDAGDVGRYASAKVRAPGVAYYDASNGDLKYFDYFTWTTNVLASDGDVGKYCSLAAWSDGTNDMMGVSYYDETRGNLMFVCGTRVGILDYNNSIVWYPPVEVDTNGNVGLYTSLSCIPVRMSGGFEETTALPIISYYDQDNGDLMYVQALDINGTTWDAPVRIASTGNVGKYSSLMGWGNWYEWNYSGLFITSSAPSCALISLSYYDESNGDLMYVYSEIGVGNGTAIGNGTGWSAPIAVDTNGNVGKYNSMMIINTNPAISYYDESNGDLMYVRSTSGNGSSWGEPVRVAANGNVGQYSSLGVIWANPGYILPMIAYYDQTLGKLKTVTANDLILLDTQLWWTIDVPGVIANGASWNTPLLRDRANTNNAGQFASLMHLAGDIFYYDVSAAVLKDTYDGGRVSVLGVNRVPITNGDPASVAAGTDFGNIPVGQSVVHNMAVTNDANGDEVLECIGIISNGAGSAAFRVEGMPHFVAGNTVSNFGIRFTPPAAGVYTTTLVFVNNGWGDSDVVSLRGSAYNESPAPEPTPSPTPPPATASSLRSRLKAKIGSKSTSDKADFVVQGLGVSPAKPTCTSAFTVNVQVKNIGGQKADAGDVLLAVNDVVIGSIKVGSLDKKKTKKVTFTGVRNPTGAKPIKITAKADCNNVTGETNEGNNTRTISVKCK